MRFFFGTTLQVLVAAGAGLSLPFWSVSASAELRSEMRLFSDSFISSAFEATQKKNYQFVGAHLSTEEQSSDALRVDISGAIAFGEPLLNYLNIAEFYVEPISEKTPEPQKLSIGRKKLNWNDLDARWELGVWEPVFKWNPLSPSRQGLTGLFWEVDKPTFSLTLFASPIFIPDQGPSFDIQNGEFVRGNPWFNRPPDSIRIFQTTTPIEYQFQKPNDTQVVLQRSYGLKISTGDPKKGLFVQGSQIYKPANQLAIGYDGVLSIPKNRGLVDLQPQVFYHSLSGADLTYAFGNAKVGVSGLYDHPSQENIFESKWTHPVFSDAFLASVFTEYHWSYFTFHIQRLDITGGKVTEEGSLADPNRRPLMTRYPFRQANEIGVGGNLNFSKVRRLSGTLSYLQNDKNDFSLVKFNTQLKLSNLWTVYSEMQLIEAASLTVDNQNEIAQYANNDRFLMGVAYVF